MKVVNVTLELPAQRCLAAVLLLALSGCVSAVSEDKIEAAAPAATAAPDIAAPTAPTSIAQANVGPQGQHTGYVDPAMVSAHGNAAQPQTQTPHVAAASASQSGQQVYGQTPQISGLATQPTGISASSLSIYANSEPRAAAVPAQPDASANVPAYAPSQKVAPAFNSVYSAPATAQQPANPAVLPVGENHSANAVPSSTPAPAPAMAQNTPNKAKIPTDSAGVPIAAFFATAAKNRGASAADGLTQVAALPNAAMASKTAGIALSGRASMTDEFDDTHVDDDDKPAGLMKLASLSGLSRVAPNGLLLQTEQVNVGCFKPEMIRRIKEVEAHYGRPAMVTSGYRPPKATTQGSKHYTCDAADIQVHGVTKWELATYLRSLPDRGGVGTYCHTESVHMDLGEPRDWNWRCRRTAKTSDSL